MGFLTNAADRQYPDIQYRREGLKLNRGQFNAKILGPFLRGQDSLAHVYCYKMLFILPDRRGVMLFATTVTTN